MKLDSNNDLLKPIFIVFIATFIGGICNYLYQLYMGRILGPTEYGIFGSLFAISYIIFVLAGTIQTSSARFISNFVGRNETEKIRPFLSGMYKRMFILGVVILFIFAICSPFIASFLRINSTIPVIIVGTFFLFSMIPPINMGVMQGLQKFVPFGFCVILNFSSKLLFGVLLVSLGFGVNGALIAFSIGAAIALLASFYYLNPFIKKIPTSKTINVNFADVYKYSLPTILTMFCFALPANVDVIIVKHVFSPEQAGFYTATSVIGKIVLFITDAIAIAMFPKVTEAYAMKKSSISIFIQSIFFTGLISGSVAIFYWFFPSLVVEIPFGAQYIQAIPLVKIYGIAMFLFALSFVVMRYSLAIHDFKFVVIFSLFSFIGVGLISIFHNSMIEMITILIFTYLAWLIFSIIYIIYRVPRYNKKIMAGYYDT